MSVTYWEVFKLIALAFLISTPTTAAGAALLWWFMKQPPHLVAPNDTKAKRVDVGCWHIASFRCAAVFGRYRGIADIE
ncbi:hypothetical protein CP49_08150 [Bradyrhizobium valentinum]|uniref:Uncharacterized protein n=1 Tax=Bradyrhizobium valentinum TaxID=1518501 RepID=A0A0R3LWH9_9BRAD|nr:hypothetical protein CP49_08150 [Bradyrhizobium valentinum]